MSKKTSGLGRGLGDLLEDNAPELKSATVIRRDGEGEVSVSPIATSYVNEENETVDAKPLVFPSVTPITGGSEVKNDQFSETKEKITEHNQEKTEPIRENSEIPRTRSLKAVFRNFK